MSLLRPFPALRPGPDRASEVLAPPYDVLNTAEARARVEGHPDSFLHVSKAEIDLPADTDPYASVVYETAARNLRRLIQEGALIRDPDPRFYVYRMDTEDHSQTGIAGAASLDGYADGRIRKHELTRPAKEDDRVRQIEAVGGHTGPVFLAYRSRTALDALLEAVTHDQPASDGTVDGVRHRLWPVADPDLLARLQQELDALDALYIADGHHRSAAAERVGAARSGAGWHRWFMGVAFPDNQVRILDYNRVVRDLSGRDPEAFLEALRAKVQVESVPGPHRPRGAGEFGMYLAGAWWRLQVAEPDSPETDPVERLDVRLLERFVLEPLLGIQDPRRDPRIDFVGGTRGLEELERRVDGGDMAVAFALHPTSLSELFAVADAGAMMPAKSTWFDPKLADGMVSLMLDDPA